MTIGNANVGDLNDDDLEALQRAADGETPDTNPAIGADNGAATTTTTNAAADDAGEQGEGDTTQADAAAATAAGADAADDTTTAKVEGIASKDGARILPYAALQAERRNARTANARLESTTRELEEARQLIADMKAGKTPDSGVVSEADVAQMEEDFPEQGKKMRALFERQKEMDAQQPAPKGKDLDVQDDPVQDAIDQVPMLVEWQHGDPEKFSRAIAIDASLLDSPKWRDKPVAQRFEHVTRLVAEEFDIAIPAGKASPPKAPTPSADAKAVAAQATRAAPNTLSDFKGGSVADHGSENLSKMSPRAMLGRFSEMTDDEMDAHLAKLG